MKSFLTTIIAFLYSLCANAQHSVYQNLDFGNATNKEISTLIEKYINSEIKPEDAFSQYDIDTYKTIDVMKESLSLAGSLYAITFDANILSIKTEGENYIVKTMVYWHNDANKTITVLAVLDFWVKRENSQLKISNYLNYYTQHWSTVTVDTIKYVYNSDFAFDIQSAQIAVNFYNGLYKLFNIKGQEKLTYFIANNCNEVNQMCGFDYFISQGNDSNLCAFYDQENDIIFSGNSEREMNLHEIIHTINKHFPTANQYMLIGLSCYINDAGSKGKDVLFHLKRFLEYSKVNQLDYENFDSFENIDNYTNIAYVTAPIICNAIYKKGGINLILDFLKDTKDIAVFKAKLKKEFKIKSFEAFFKSEFEVYLKQKKSLLYID
jgi:hypothetical protein